MDLISDSFLNILNLGSSDFVDKCLHLGLIDLPFMVNVNRVEESI